MIFSRIITIKQFGRLDIGSRLMKSIQSENDHSDRCVWLNISFWITFGSVVSLRLLDDVFA